MGEENWFWMFAHFSVRTSVNEKLFNTFRNMLLRAKELTALHTTSFIHFGRLARFAVLFIYPTFATEGLALGITRGVGIIAPGGVQLVAPARSLGGGADGATNDAAVPPSGLCGLGAHARLLREARRRGGGLEAGLRARQPAPAWLRGRLGQASIADPQTRPLPVPV